MIGYSPFEALVGVRDLSLPVDVADVALEFTVLDDVGSVVHHLALVRLVAEAVRVGESTHVDRFSLRWDGEMDQQTRQIGGEVFDTSTSYKMTPIQ